MDTPFRRRDGSEIVASVNRFENYHKTFNPLVEADPTDWNSVDRGLIVQKILPPEVQDLIGRARGKESQSYGPEKGDPVLRTQIAELENLRHGTSYTRDHVGMVAGAWNGVVCSVEHLMKGTWGGPNSKESILAIGPTLYQMFYGFLEDGLNVIAHDYTLEGASHTPSSEDVDAMFKEKPRVIVITNPNNPDGLYMAPEVLKQIIERAATENTYVIIDEVQNCFPVEGKELGYGPWIQAPHVIRTDSRSKSYSLAECRQGWVIADPSLIGDRLHGIVGRMSRDMANAPRVGNSALMNVFQNEKDIITSGADPILKDEYERVTEQEQHFEKVAQRIKGINILVRHACTNRVITLPQGAGTDMEITSRLIHEHRSLIMPASGYGYDQRDAALRITFTVKPQKLDNAMRAIECLLKATNS